MKRKRHIREATADDAGDLKNCMEAAYSGYQQRMGGVRLPPLDADYLSEIKNYPSWVIESDGKILGGLIMVIGKEKAAIANIAVNPEFQGQGIGGELMKFAESRARKKNFSELHLVTHVLLEENIALYQYLGWKETARDETRVIMTKEIGIDPEAEAE